MGSIELTPAQRDVFENLLAIGARRPVTPTNLLEQLRQRIELGVVDLRWTEKRLWMGKSMLTNVLRCEGLVKAEAVRKTRGPMHPSVAVGIVVHRAIALADTHPDSQSILWYVEEALEHSKSEPEFAAFWANARASVQSELLMNMVSKTTGFLDSWPPLDDLWDWRFEESVQAKIGTLTLGARIDLVLGRPKTDGRQTMLLADFKSTGLSDHHHDEAMFYALVATLRYGIPPFRSVVYSLTSGEWTEPDVTAEALFDIADKVIRAARSHTEVLTETRDAELTPGLWCRYCPARDTCPSSDTADADAQAPRSSSAEEPASSAHAQL